MSVHDTDPREALHARLRREYERGARHGAKLAALRLTGLDDDPARVADDVVAALHGADAKPEACPLCGVPA